MDPHPTLTGALHNPPCCCGVWTRTRLRWATKLLLRMGVGFGGLEECRACWDMGSALERWAVLRQGHSSGGAALNKAAARNVAVRLSRPPCGPVSVTVAHVAHVQRLDEAPHVDHRVFVASVGERQIERPPSPHNIPRVLDSGGGRPGPVVRAHQQNFKV